MHAAQKHALGLEPRARTGLGQGHAQKQEPKARRVNPFKREAPWKPKTTECSPAYFALALVFEPPLPTTEAARDAAPLAVATTAPAATLAVALTARIALPATDLSLAAGFLGLAVALPAAGTTFFGAAVPKLGFAASFERAATAGVAVFDPVAFD
jgi:hypothetical protein